MTGKARRETSKSGSQPGVLCSYIAGTHVEEIEVEKGLFHVSYPTGLGAKRDQIETVEQQSCRRRPAGRIPIKIF